MKQSKKLAAFVAAFALSFSAFAEENADKSGFYVSPEVGQVKLKDWCSTWLDIESEFKCEDSEIGFGLSGGYWFNDHFAAEGGLRLANGFDVRYIDTFDDTITGEADLQSLSLGLRGRIPFGERFAAIGKAGVHFWEQEIKVTDTAFPGDSRGEEDGTDPYFGAGAEFSFTDNIAVRAEYTRYNGDALDADFISGSFVWNF